MTEWYRNCAGLVDYFVGQDRYRDAEHCLRACDAIIEHHMAVPVPPTAPRDIEIALDKVSAARNGTAFFKSGTQVGLPWTPGC